MDIYESEDEYVAQLEYILSRFKSPKNKGNIENPDICYEDGNPSCGDIIKMYLKIVDGKIEDVKFDGKGCAISQVSADILSDMIKGKTLDEAKFLEKDELLRELGIQLSAVRLKCALLSLKVLKMGVWGIKVEIDGE